MENNRSANFEPLAPDAGQAQRSASEILKEVAFELEKLEGDLKKLPGTTSMPHRMMMLDLKITFAKALSTYAHAEAAATQVQVLRSNDTYMNRAKGN